MIAAEDKCEFMSIPPGTIDMMWPTLAPLLSKGVAMSHGELTLDEVYRDALLGHYQLWVMARDTDVRSALVTRLVEYESGLRVCNLMLAGGHALASWDEEIRRIEGWARENNCDELRIIGRKGWEKHMRRFGYTHINTIIGRKL